MASIPSNSRRRFLSTAAIVGTTAGISPLISRAGEERSAKMKELRRFRLPVPQARSLAVDGQGRIHLAAGRGVTTIDGRGKALQQIQLPRAARCLDVSPQGDLFVGTLRAVHRFDTNGQPIARWEELGEQSNLSDLSAGREDVALFDAGQGTVWRYDHAGRRLAAISEPGSFAAPVSFFNLLRTATELHVANPQRHRIEQYSIAGEQVAVWGERSRELSGFAGCCNPVSFAVLKDGTFITVERGEPRLKEFDPTGKFRRLIAGPEEFAETTRTAQQESNGGCQLGGFDLAVDSQDRVYLLDRVANEIRVYG